MVVGIGEPVASEEYPPALEDDVRHRMFALALRGQRFALATIAAADGGPRPVGSQILIDADGWYGFLSGGCIEADIGRHGSSVLSSGAPRHLVYGRGSPFIDMRLPCGGRLEVLVERIEPGDPAVSRLCALTLARQPARWVSNGRDRWCGPVRDAAEGVSAPCIDMVHQPQQRLLVFGTDPYALAIAMQGRLLNWEVTLLNRHGEHVPAIMGVAVRTMSTGATFDEIGPDPWTAIAVASHDPELDHQVLVAALTSNAGYVGVLGARRRLPERLSALRDAGLDDSSIERLRAPIGLPLGATNAREVAVAVIAQIVAERHGASATLAPA